MQKRFVCERCPSPSVNDFPAFFEISFQRIFEHGYHDGIDQSHAAVTHDQTWIRFGWEKLSFSAPDSIQEVWYGRNVMTPCDQGCYSQWGIVFYRVPHNYFINVAVLLTEQDIARCVYVSDSQPGRNSSPGRNFINSGEELVTYSLYSKCCTSFLSLHWLFQFIIFIFVSYLVDYHTFLLTN